MVCFTLFNGVVKMKKFKNVFFALVCTLIVLIVIGLPVGLIAIKLIGCEAVVTENLDIVRNIIFSAIGAVVLLFGLVNE
jgi:hypothetical protein